MYICIIMLASLGEKRFWNGLLAPLEIFDFGF